MNTSLLKSWTDHPLAALQRETDRLMKEFDHVVPSFSALAPLPRVDVETTDKNVVVTAELPGMDVADVEVTLRDSELTIRGEKKEKRESKDGECRVVERRYGAFTRVLDLPVSVADEGLEARFDAGVLKITLPRAPSDKDRTRKIEIKS